MSERIVINLDQTDTKAYESENLIQADAQKSFDRLIQKFLKAIEENKNELKNNRECKIDRVHNTILINGKRGMGKTSFILSIQKNKYILKDIEPLCIIDPTLIETKENVLLNIITLIKEKVEDFIKCEKCDDKSTKYKDWKESLKKLAGGLSMLDGVGSNHLSDGMWDSPELILEKGLSNAKQGVDLEKNFHNFIDESLKIIEKEAFFLILDDIDTSLDKGTAILETLRKYLTSRKLIIAILGDIDLYSTLVRQLQWEKMDPKNILLKYEFNENKNAYVNQIEHLEEQYLTKVLKPENRIDLKNLLTLKNKLAINTDDNYFEDVMQEMIKKVYFTKDSGYAKYFENTFLTQSTRSIIQFLQVWNLNKKLDLGLIERFRHTFYTTLKKKLEEYSLVEVPEKEKFLNLLAVYILNENSSKENHLKLMPNFAKDDDNITMLYLNMMANYLLKPQDYLSYFIKVGYVYKGYEDIETKEKKVEFIDNIIILDAGYSLSMFSEKILSSLKIETTTMRNGYRYFGNMFIKGKDLDDLSNQASIELLTQIAIQKQKSYNFISFFSLLAHLADVKNHQNDLIGWSQNITKIQEIPLYVLSKIWIRFANTIYIIEDRPENSNKDYAEIFLLYIAGFLNAIYVEIELYFSNKEIKIDNISTSTKPYIEKLKKYNKHKDEDGEMIYTLFDYLHECPLLNFEAPYFEALKKIPMPIEKEKFEEQSKNKQREALLLALEKIEKNAGPEPKQAIKDKKFDNAKLITSIVNQLRNQQAYLVGTNTGREILKEHLKDIFR